MRRLGLLVAVCGCAIAADRNTIVTDPAVARAFKDRYIALADSCVRGIEFTPAESAAMEAGKKWEALMMQGPDDPLGKRILAAGEPSFDAVRSAELHPNVYLETSGAQVADLQFALERIGVERILFGTDLPIGGAASAKWNMVKIRSAVPEAARQRAIFGENARRVLALSAR